MGTGLFNLKSQEKSRLFCQRDIVIILHSIKSNKQSTASFLNCGTNLLNQYNIVASISLSCNWNVFKEFTQNNSTKQLNIPAPSIVIIIWPLGLTNHKQSG